MEILQLLVQQGANQNVQDMVRDNSIPVGQDASSARIPMPKLLSPQRTTYGVNYNLHPF